MRKPRRILITGICGTIGRAFVEHLRKDYILEGIDRNEAAVAKFKEDYPDIYIACGDVSDIYSVRYSLIIHLAAMKHIDLCELNATACIQNNVIKPYKLFLRAKAAGADVLFMSTDKAVEPVSMYGYSKALIEGLCTQLGFAVVRSGNVVASNGSVSGVWRNAIERRSPLKITHPDMRRYFISPEHLVRRVWEQYKADVRLIIPKMDRNIKLVDLAKELLLEYGEDFYAYPIEYTGLRPGEKLREKLQWKIEQ